MLAPTLSFRRRLGFAAALLTACCCLLIAGAPAQADVSLPAGAPGTVTGLGGPGFHFAAATFSASESAGQAVITVTRGDDVARQAWVRYVAVGVGHPCGSAPCTAQYKWDFDQVQGTLSFPPLVVSQTFTVPLVDHHAASIPQTFQVGLYGAYPTSLGAPAQAVVTVNNDDPLSSTLTGVGGAVTAPVVKLPTASNPLAPMHFFVDQERPLPEFVAQGHRELAQAAAQPWVERFGSFSGADVGQAVAHFLARAAVEQPGTVPQLSTYRLVYGHCGHWSDPPSEIAAYENFISRFAQGIGSYHAVLFLEMDSIITASCLTPHGYAVRMAELNYAINALTTNCPNLVVYLDAGAADALPPAVAAKRLRDAGVAKIQGFFLNSTHYDWTLNEIKYGEKISALTGGKHFVVNTSMGGRGPEVPRDRVKDGNEVLCNPVGRGLGPLPTATTGYPNADAFSWILHPGESTGPCGAGAPATGLIWLAYLQGLIHNQNLTVH